VLETLAKIGVDYREIYASRFIVTLGTTSTMFRPTEGIGYYFLAPGKKPYVVHGVMTDTDLLQAASKYFGVSHK
jgi:hypothetical protein